MASMLQRVGLLMLKKYVDFHQEEHQIESIREKETILVLRARFLLSSRLLNILA